MPYSLGSIFEASSINELHVTKPQGDSFIDEVRMLMNGLPWS